MIDRRRFLGSVTLALLAQTVGSRRLLASGASPRLQDWVRSHEKLALELQEHPERGAEWQRGVEELSARIDLDEILRGIDFTKIERELKFTTDGGTKQSLRFPNVTFGAAIFGLEQGKSITPHGHRNMVSAHLVLSGTLRARNFDRIADEPSHLVLRPTVDATIGPGACSTMSTQRNNVHWFTALTERAFTLDVVVSEPSYLIDLVDPLGGTKLGNGDIRAPRIDWKTSVRKYAF